MFEDIESQLDRILKIVAKCPQNLQEKCFEVLLTTYLKTLGAERKPTTGADKGKKGQQSQAEKHELTPPDEIPQEIRRRFENMAKRLTVSVTDLARLFDFTADPFSYHALQVPGKSKADKTRNAALLVATRNYLVTGHWTGDWNEFKSMCVDQNCYDRANNPQIMKHAYFKNASPETGIELSGGGQKAAEALLKSLAQPTE